MVTRRVGPERPSRRRTSSSSSSFDMDGSQIYTVSITTGTLGMHMNACSAVRASVLVSLLIIPFGSVALYRNNYASEPRLFLTRNWITPCFEKFRTIHRLFHSLYFPPTCQEPELQHLLGESRLIESQYSHYFDWIIVNDDLSVHLHTHTHTHTLEYLLTS